MSAHTRTSTVHCTPAYRCMTSTPAHRAIKAKKAAEEAAARKILEEAKAIAQALQMIGKFAVKKTVGEDKRIFGSVTGGSQACPSACAALQAPAALQTVWHNILF